MTFWRYVAIMTTVYVVVLAATFWLLGRSHGVAADDGIAALAIAVLVVPLITFTILERVRDQTAAYLLATVCHGFVLVALIGASVSG